MAKEIKQMMIDSKLVFEGIDYDSITKYLGEYMEVKERKKKINLKTHT